MTYGIEAEGLTKRFGETQALAGVDLAAREGTVLGVLGPNGAGKTTAVRVLATLLQPDAGTARVAGHDVVGEPAAVRARIGLTGQYASVDEDLTGTQNLLLIGQLLGMRTGEARARAAELLEWFDLTEAAARPAKTYSGGMRRRLDLAASLVGRPSVIFLDEPTTGLDPAKREEMWDVVRRVVADGATVLLTTQYLEEADALADEITVIDRGRVIAHDTPDGLKKHVGGQRLRVRPLDASRLGDVRDVLTRLTGTAPEETPRHELICRVDDDSLLPELVGRLRDERIPVSELSLHLPSLDEVFLTLTGRTAGDGAVPGRRVALPPAEPRRGLPHPDRPHGRRRRDHRGGGMTTDLSPDIALPARRLPVAENRPPTSSPLWRQAVVLARRALIKTWRTPEALVDVTLQPIIFLALFTYVFGGAIAHGSQHAYLIFLLPGLLGQTIAMASVSLGQNLNTDIQKGVFDRFRSLPIARSAPLIGAVLADVARYLILFAFMMGSGLIMGFRASNGVLPTLAALVLSMGFALCFGWVSVFV